MQLPRLAVPALIVLSFIACSSGTELERCPKTVLEMANHADTGWRATVLDSLDGVDDAFIVEPAFFFEGSVTDSDRTFIDSIGGTVIYEFRGFPALTARISAGNMRAFANSGTNARITRVELGLPVNVSSVCE